MIAVTLFAVAALCGGAVAGQSARAAKDQRPKITLGTKEWRFGSVWQGESLSREFTLKNTGDAPLEILEVTSSCSCTVAKPERTRLAAGESTVFLVSLKTHTRTGPVNAVVTVKSNDPLNPRVELAVEGEVRPAFKIDPTNSVTLGRITTATQLTRKIDIHNLYPEPARLSLEPIESSPWDVKLIEVKPGREYRLEVTTRPPSPVGFVRRVATIKTGLEQVPELTVTINSLVQPLVQVTPNRIRVPRRFKRKTEQTVRVTYDASLDLRITEVKVVGAEMITAELLPPPAKPSGGSMRTRRIRVRLPAGVEMPRENAWLEIHTNHPEFEKLLVHFTEPPRRIPGRPLRSGSPKPVDPAEGGKKESGRP